MKITDIKIISLHSLQNLGLVQIHQRARCPRLWLFIAIVLLACVSCHHSPVYDARENIPIGTPRNEAILTLIKDAWYYEPCVETAEKSATDLFFFGSHKYDKAEIVIVRSRFIDDVFQVQQISSFENYAWQSAYADCIQCEMFEDSHLCIGKYDR